MRERELYTIDELCEEINKDKNTLIQSCYQKKQITDVLFDIIEKENDIKIFLTDRSKKTQQELITREELEHQENRKDKYNRNYIELSIMFSINDYFEEVMRILSNLYLDTHLIINKNKYSYNNKTVEADFLSEDENDCYDLQGRMFNLNNVVNRIYIHKNKIDVNYIKYFDKYKNYFFIYYTIQNNKDLSTIIIKFQIVDVKDMINNKKYKNYGNEFDNVEYQGNINFKTFLIENKKKIKEIEEMTKEQYNSIQQLTETCKFDTPMIDILTYYNIDVNKDNMFCCPFHNDEHPSAKWFEDTNKMYCFTEGITKDNIDLVGELEGFDIKNQFLDILDKIAEISKIMSNSCNVRVNREYKEKNKDSLEREKDYEKWVTFGKTLEELLEEEKERKQNGTFIYRNRLIEIINIYFDERGIDYEKCKDILKLNNYRITFSSYHNYNNFYLDYDMNNRGQHSLVQRNVNDIINRSRRFKDSSGKQIILPEPSAKKFHHGTQDIRIIKTTRGDLRYYIDENGKRHFKTLMIFEGIMDALSLISMTNKIEDYTIVVLNSTTNINQFFYKNQDNEYQFKEQFEGFQKIELLLDDDESGRKATETFKEKYVDATLDDEFDDLEVFELKLNEKEYNDFNEYWVELRKLLNKNNKKVS